MLKPPVCFAAFEKASYPARADPAFNALSAAQGFALACGVRLL
jgi:hypothetical protein